MTKVHKFDLFLIIWQNEDDYDWGSIIVDDFFSHCRFLNICSRGNINSLVELKDFYYNPVRKLSLSLIRLLIRRKVASSLRNGKQTRSLLIYSGWGYATRCEGYIRLCHNVAIKRNAMLHRWKTPGDPRKVMVVLRWGRVNETALLED